MPQTFCLIDSKSLRPTMSWHLHLESAYLSGVGTLRFNSVRFCKALGGPQLESSTQVT